MDSHLDEFLSGLVVTDTSSGLDLEARGALLEKLNITEVGSTRTETCRSLNEIGSCLVHKLGNYADLVLSEKTSLHNNLEDALIATSLLDLPDLFADAIKIALLQPPDVNNHINLISSVLNGLTCLEYLNLGCRVAEGETNHCRDLDLGMLKENLGLLDEAWRDAHSREVVGVGLNEDLSDVLPAGTGLQHGLIDVLVNLDLFILVLGLRCGMR